MSKCKHLFTFYDRLGGRIDQVQAPGVLDVFWGNFTAFAQGANRERLIPVHLVSLALRAVNGHHPGLETFRYMVRVTRCIQVQHTL